MHRAVDLDEVVRALRDRQHVERLAADGQPELEPARSLDIHLHRTTVKIHVIPVWSATGHPQPVGLAACADVDLVERLVPDLRTPALGGSEQAVLLPSGVRLVGLERGGQQGDVDPPRRGVTVGHHRVEPGRVDLAAHELRPLQQVEQEGLVRGPAADDRDRLPDARDSRARASARSRPQAITLAIMESNCGGMTSPGATPVSTLIPGRPAAPGARSGPGRARSRAPGPRR